MDNNSHWSFEIIQDDSGFYNIKDEWNSLQEQLSDPNSSPFLSWVWMYSWWSIYKKSWWCLRIGVIRYKLKIVGIFPFYLKRFPIKQLYFLGTGEKEKEEVSAEYLDCLMLSEIENLSGFAKKLFDLMVCKVDVFVFLKIVNSSYIFNLVKNMDVLEVNKIGFRYFLSLDREFDHVVKNLKSNVKRKFNKYNNSLGSEEIDFDVCSSELEINDYFNNLVRLHSLRWWSKGFKGVFLSRRFFDFHYAISKWFFSEKKLHLAIIRISDVVVGAIYAFDVNGVRYFYQSGFDPKFEYVSPGHLLHYFSIKNAISRCMKGYDFMLGGLVKSYKNDYTDKGEVMLNVVVAKNKIKLTVFKLTARLSKLIE